MNSRKEISVENTERKLGNPVLIIHKNTEIDFRVTEYELKH